MLDRLEELEREYEAILIRLSDPAVVGDHRLLRDVSRRHRELEQVVVAFRQYKAAEGDLAAAREMLADATSSEDREAMRAEVDAGEVAVAPACVASTGTLRKNTAAVTSLRVFSIVDLHV